MMKFLRYPMLKQLVYFVVLLGLSGPVVASPDSLLALTPARRFGAIRKAYQDSWPDSLATRQLRQRLEAFFRERDDAHGLLLAETAFLEAGRNLDRYNPDFPQKVTQLLRRAEALPDAPLQAKLNLMLGLYYFNIQKNFYLAFRHYLTTFDLIKGLTEAEFPDRDYTIYLIARAYYEFFDYPTSIRIARTLNQEPGHRVANTHIYNTCLLGMAAVKQKDYAAARRYFEWGLHQLPVRDFNNEAWVGILKGYLGLLLVEQQREAEAQPYLEEGLKLTRQFQVWDIASQLGGKLAEISIEGNQLVRAGELARQAHQDALKTRMPKFTHPTYQLLSDYYRQMGQTAPALLYADSARTARDAYQREIDQTLKLKAEMAAENERQQLRAQLLEQEKQRQILIRNGLILLILLALVVAYLLYHRQILIHRHRQEQLLSEKLRAETALSAAKAQLDQFTRNIQEKSELIEQFRHQLSQLESQQPVAGSQYELLERLQHSVLLTDEGWEEFRQLFEKVHHGYLARLRQKWPELSPAEIRYLALCKLNYTGKEMAVMLGVGTDTIRQYRSRLRRKLKLSEEISFEEVAARV